MFLLPHPTGNSWTPRCCNGAEMQFTEGVDLEQAAFLPLGAASGGAAGGGTSLAGTDGLTLIDTQPLFLLDACTTASSLDPSYQDRSGARQLREGLAGGGGLPAAAAVSMGQSPPPPLGGAARGMHGSGAAGAPTRAPDNAAARSRRTPAGSGDGSGRGGAAVLPYWMGMAGGDGGGIPHVRFTSIPSTLEEATDEAPTHGGSAGTDGLEQAAGVDGAGSTAALGDSRRRRHGRRTAGNSRGGCLARWLGALCRGDNGGVKRPGSPGVASSSRPLAAGSTAELQAPRSQAISAYNMGRPSPGPTASMPSRRSNHFTAVAAVGGHGGSNTAAPSVCGQLGPLPSSPTVGRAAAVVAAEVDLQPNRERSGGGATSATRASPFSGAGRKWGLTSAVVSAAGMRPRVMHVNAAAAATGANGGSDALLPTGGGSGGATTGGGGVAGQNHTGGAGSAHVPGLSRASSVASHTSAVTTTSRPSRWGMLANLLTTGTNGWCSGQQHRVACVSKQRAQEVKQAWGGASGVSGYACVLLAA